MRVNAGIYLRAMGLACAAWTVLLGLIAPAAAQPVAVITEYYHADALGSTRTVTDQSGAVVRRYDYAPFGEQDSPCTTSADRRLFTGQQRDRETCLDYYGARHYRSTLGRFLTIDPALDISSALVDPQRWNRYAYARNNPTKFVDPDGKNPLLLLGGIAWGAYELGSLAYDVYTAIATVNDPSATRLDKELAVAAAATSVIGPGGGYTVLARRASRAAEATTVYQATDAVSNAVSYVGITNNLSRRSAEHLASKGIDVKAIPGLERLSRQDARSVEQALIELHRLGKNGGTLVNKINSIAPGNSVYLDRLRRGMELLDEIGYRFFE